MINRVKKWLGIEGVKMELIVEDEYSVKTGMISGKIRFTSMNDQLVTHTKLALVEKYRRGRRKGKLIDEYTLNEIVLEQDVEVIAEEIVEMDFQLPFTLLKSDIDSFGDKNFIFGGLVKGAKLLRNVKSEYRIEAESKVKGVALNPFDKKVIKIKR